MALKPDPVDASRARQLGEGLIDQMSRQMPDMNDIFWCVRNGASLSVTDREGMTPLVKAMCFGNRPLIEEMVRYGADVNFPCGKTKVTAMQIAASSGNLEIVKLLTEAGGNLLQKNAAGFSALDCARRNPNDYVLAYLEEAARPQLEAVAAAERHEKSIRAGMPVEKPFPPLKPIRFRPG